MTFEEYKAEDFLQDESFLNYCLAKDDEAVKYWTAWLNAHPHKKMEAEQAIELYHVMNGGHTAVQYQEDERFFSKALADYQQNEERPGAAVVTRKWWYIAAAAVVAGAIVIGSFFYLQSAQLSPAYSEISKPGERRSFQLADGSNILLNSGSTLTVAEGFNDSKRGVTLKGEAFFEVAHMPEKPFVIYTEAMVIKVLGTTFSVKAYEGEAQSQTSLIEGSVEITLKHDNNRKVTLAPNQKLVYRKAEIKPAEPKQIEEYAVIPIKPEGDPLTTPGLSWTRNRLIFEDEGFAEIASTLERWFDVEIEIKSEKLEEYRFTGTFEKKTIREVMDALQLSGGFDYELSGRKIVVTSRD